jgi:ABC-type bacteriocin/lantibiotic exporter with double-glycine peptidase domain
MRAITALFALAACVPENGGAHAVQPAQLDAHWLRAAPTPVVVQRQEADCGLAALAMVAGTWGQTVSVKDLAQRTPPSGNGIKLGALRDLARGLGLDAFAIHANIGDLRHELSAGRPVLLGLVLPYDRERNRAHYEVAVALDPRDGTVVTIDPATGGWQSRQAKVFDVEWKASGYAALVVTGTGVVASRRWQSPSSTTPHSSSVSTLPMR